MKKGVSILFSRLRANHTFAAYKRERERERERRKIR